MLPYLHVIKHISLISAYSLISAGQLLARKARYLAHLAYKTVEEVTLFGEATAAETVQPDDMDSTRAFVAQLEKFGLGSPDHLSCRCT